MRPVFAIEGEQVAIDGGPEKGVSGDRHALVDFVGVVVGGGIEGAGNFPELAAGHGIEGDHLKGGAGVDDAVHDQWRVLHLRLVLRRFLVNRVVHPLHLQILDVVAIDLRQRAVTLARIAARIGEPILRLALSVQKTVVRHLGKQGAGNEDKREQNAILHEPSLCARADYISPIMAVTTVHQERQSRC